jgi:hypothetical protein
MGSNYPWTSPAAFAGQQSELRAFPNLDLPQIKSIERGNALKLFPRL